MAHRPLALAAAALIAGLMSFGAAQAATVATGSTPVPALQQAQDSNIQQAAHRYRYWRGGNRYRYWRGGNRYRYWGGGRRYWGPGSGVYLGFGAAPYYYGYGPYYQPYAYRPYYAPTGGSAHVRWCLNRYRSYDPRSNTFLGYDGYRHRCRSPYRY